VGVILFPDGSARTAKKQLNLCRKGICVLAICNCLEKNKSLKKSLVKLYKKFTILSIYENPHTKKEQESSIFKQIIKYEYINKFAIIEIYPLASVLFVVTNLN
jgi:hypothetical protein